MLHSLIRKFVILGFLLTYLILWFFKKITIWIHFITPAGGRFNINSFLNVVPHSKQICCGRKYSIFSRSEVMMKWYQDESDQNIQKHDFLKALSTNHEILRLFQRKIPGATRWPHQLVHHPSHQLVIPNIFTEDTKLYLIFDRNLCKRCAVTFELC